MDELKSKMDKAVGSVENGFSQIRTGRANPALLESVKIKVYGQEMGIKQLATVSIADARTLTISPFDKGTMGDIEKGIMESGLGLTPINDGKLIRISIPALTEERRRDLIKVIKKEAEEGKVVLRNIRRDYLDKIKKQNKDSGLGADQIKGTEDKVQKVVDEYVKKVDALTARKEKELLEV
jgi:ribosome recycling factor